jgi:cullin 1
MSDIKLCTWWKRRAQTCTDNSSTSVLSQKSRKRLKEENRIDQFLDTDTREQLISKCEYVLIRQHSSLMWESFQSLLDFGEDKDLQRMYALLEW